MMRSRSLTPRSDAEHLAAFSLLVFLAMSGFALSLPLRGMPSDLASLVDSGRRITAGINPYGAQVPNLNPPISLPLCIFLAQIKGQYVAWVWFTVGIAAYVVALVLLFRTYLPRPTLLQALWPLSIAPLWELALGLGNIYPLLCLLAVGIAIAVERDRTTLAGILLGLLVAIKPNFAVWPLLLLASRHGRFGVSAGISALTFSILPLFAFGSSPYIQWLRAVSELGWYAAVANVSLYGAAARVGFPLLGIVGSAVLALLALWFAASRRLDAATVSIAGTVLALLLSPLAWPGYTLTLLPLFFSRPWSRPIRVVAALFLVPAYAFYALWQVLPVTMSLIGMVYLMALMTLLFEIGRQSRRLAGERLLPATTKLW